MDSSSPTKAVSAEAIQKWILEWLAREMQIPADDLDAAKSFESFGMTSLLAVTMTGDLEDWLGREVDPAIMYDHPTVAGLAGALAGQSAS
jgi:acyl carrier protein